MLQGASRTCALAAMWDGQWRRLYATGAARSQEASLSAQNLSRRFHPRILKVALIQSKVIKCWKRWGCCVFYLWHCLTSTHTHAHLLPFMYTAGTLDLNQLLWWKACRQTLMSNFLIIQSHYPRGHHNTNGSFSRLCCVSLGFKHKACHHVQR